MHQPGAQRLPPRPGHVLLTLAFLAALGCLAPRKGRDARGTGSVAELGRRMAETGAKPVQGKVEEGASVPATDPFVFADPDDPAVRAALEEALAEEAQEAADDEPFVESPYLRFGERIILRAEGANTFISKPYSMPPGKAKKVLELMAALEPFPFRPRAEGNEAPPLDPEFIEYQLLEEWDQEYYTDFEAAVPKASTPVTLSDILVVTAAYERLEQFEEFLDLFAAAGVPQIELEAKIIEINETDTTDVGVNSSFEFSTETLVQALDFGFPNLTSSSEAVATLGAVQDDTIFNAIIDLLETWDNVQIDSRPKTVVRAGGVASIDSTVEIPFFEIKNFTEGGNAVGNIVYKKVGTQLFISPRIIGTKTMALEVHLIGSQQAGNVIVAGVQGTNLTAPQIAYRTAKTVVYLEPGQTLVIGGLTQHRDRELVSQVPILGDIPWLGAFFRSTFTSREKQTVLFAISPRLIQRSDLETQF